MIYNKLKLKAFILFLIGFGMFFSTNISAQEQKIEDEVRRNFESDPIQRVFVWLNDYIKVDDFRKTNNRGRDQATVTILKLLINKSNQSQLALSSKIEKEFGNTPVEWTYITNGFEIETNWQTIQKIAKWPEVKGIYADKKPTTNATIDFSPPTIVGAQPGLKSINAHKMWEMGYTGHGTKAFIFDSGEDYNHPAIRSNFNGNFAGFNKSWSGGHDRPFDVGGHGTHVTGTICGIDILGKDTIGVAFGATWIGGPIQFNNSPKQPYKVKSFAQNFQYAINPDGDSTTTDDMPDVINNSWGDEGATNCEADDPLSEILKLFELAGVAVVWSAGNSGPNARTVDYYQGLNYSLISGFSVGATAINKPFAIADFSSRGPSECAGDDPLDPLAIKPEVSAPGVGVRSSYLNGSYALLNGTSMAAPHVSGAVLLLKEAFPYLSGNDFLMALYMSAVDLGASGEDNVYGRGIIDVYAAYLLLIENGNQPVAPASKKVDVAIIDFIETTLSPYCKESQQFNTVIYNAGIDTIYSFTLDVATDNNGTYHSDTIEWYGILLPQDTLFIILPAQYFAFGGPTIVKVGVQLPADSQESRILNNTWQREINVIDNTSPEVAINAPQKVCIGSNVLLTAENLDSDELIPAWYADATSSAPMGEGVNFIIGPVVENTSVFMEPLLHKELVYSYEIEKFKTTLIRNTGLVFDVKKDSYLNAVTVYIAKEGTYVFRLIDDKSVAIKTISASLKVGPQELKFETFMKTGDNFKLLMSLGKELGINEYDFTKAINIGDAITIKESTGFTEEENKKVFANFFDWKIAVAFPCGRKEYKIEVNEKDTIEGLELLIPDSLDLTDSNELLIQSTILDSSFIYNWTISNSPASNDPSFKVVFDSTGLYECSLLAIDSTGCSNFVSKHIFVYHENTTSVPEIQALASFTVVPNPSVSYFSLISKDYFGALSLVMHDSSGRLVKRILTYNLGDHVNIEDLTSGVYFLNIMDAKSSQVVKLVKP